MISLIVPAHNEETELGGTLRALRTAAEASGEAFELIVADDATLDTWVKLIRQYPDRFLFGSDTVAPKSQADYLKAFDAYAKLWERLDAQTAGKVKARNFERIFDAARLKVRAWEAGHIQK